jgi:chemotaxis protein methyltransferase CheR
MARAVSRSEAVALRQDSAGTELEKIEIGLLLEGIRLCYGYDFREYAMAPLRRGIMSAMNHEAIGSISAYQDRILHDATAMQRFLSTVGVNVTGMYRDADLMRCIREEVVPLFKTYPSVRIWVAGCASGEEVYALAMLLEEEKIRQRCSIYATDLNEDLLAVARTGTYPLERVKKYEESYQQSGGQASLAAYYTVAGRGARFSRDLQKNVIWARHNLVSDSSFNDFHLILCANVLIYFLPTLQSRVHRLFYDSLIRSGFLALGKRESLIWCPDHDHYEQVRDGVNLFRKTRW